MKLVAFICLLSCYYRHVWGGTSEKKNEFIAEYLWPKSLLESIQNQEYQQTQQRNGRILTGLQFVQHSPVAHSVYLPHTTDLVPNGYAPANSIQVPINTFEQQIVDLHVPTSADANKILLRLPTQHISFGVPPPRRHYRITLVRSRKPVTPPPEIQTPEVEEKTLIYVLVKKPDESSTAAQIEELQKSQKNNVKHHAPEVYFVKYKENHDASNSPTYLPSTNGQTLPSKDAIN